MIRWMSFNLGSMCSNVAVSKRAFAWSLHIHFLGWACHDTGSEREAGNRGPFIRNAASPSVSFDHKQLRLHTAAPQTLLE